jgi:competence ComEA-like helix-hairpin-helix protein
MTTTKRIVSAHGPALLALSLLVLAMGGVWHSAAAAPPPVEAAFAQPHPAAPPAAAPHPLTKSAHKELTGKLNLNLANEDQLMLLPTVGPAKADRIVAWRKKNGGFKRVADLRRVKGFGYKTFKRLEPYVDIKGDTTLAPK